MGRSPSRTWLALSTAGLFGAGCYQTQELPPPIDEPDVCVDMDADGWGEGDSCFGPDCDDFDGTVWESCGDDCAVNPQALGCPCDARAEPELCYGGPPGTQGVGTCEGGLRACRAGAWTGCEGQVVPRAEVCDLLDNDCNGVADEGVQSACGNCDPNCEVECAGVGCATAFIPSAGAEVADDGSVVVSVQADLQPHEIWFANNQGGTVVRVDARSISVVGAYRSGPNEGSDAPQSVAMDGVGNAYVVSSQLGQRSSTVTKIFGSGCPDANRNGRVETSRDEETLDWGQDECVAWNMPIEECQQGWGCGYGWGIALTDAGRSAWVSLYQGSRIVEIDTETGELTGREVGSGNPQGLVADADGYVWVASSSRSVRRFSTADVDLETFDLDAQSWITNIDLGDDGRVYAAGPLLVYDPEEDEDYSTGWQAFDVLVDDEGMIWGTDGRNLRQYDPDLEDFESFPLSGIEYQIAVDRVGQLWGAPQFGGEIVVFDTSLGEEVATSLEGCTNCLVFAQLDGDPTGVRYRRAFGGGVADSSATHVFEMCAGGWPPTVSHIGWQTTGGGVEISARRAYTREALAEAEWIPVGAAPPDEGGLDHPDIGEGHLLEVKGDLRGGQSRLVRLTAEWGCVQEF